MKLQDQKMKDWPENHIKITIDKPNLDFTAMKV